MNKREFLKTSALFFGGALLGPTACTTDKMASGKPLSNWAGNLQFSTGNVSRPGSVDELAEIVRKSARLKAIGSRHSFNTIADHDALLLSAEFFNKLISLDRERRTVTVGAGMKYGELCGILHENGFALHNLASLPHISVAGTIATATHGSGVRNGNLATAVAGLEFITSNGDPVSVSRNDGDRFYGSVVHLGAIGVLTTVTLELQPTFEMSQVVYRNLPMAQLAGNFIDIMSAGYSVSLFTDWRNRNINEVWVKSRADQGTSAPEELYGAKAATVNLHPVEELSAESCTEQLGVPGPWYDRLPHFKMGFQPSTGKELQSEYFVPLEKGYEAIMAVAELADQISPHLFISEIRTIAADELWMSPNYRRPSVAIHTTWKQEPQIVMELIRKVESALAPFNPRPHWGKLFTFDRAFIQSQYEKIEDFRVLVKEYDPEGKFRNTFLDTYVL